MKKPDISLSLPVGNISSTPVLGKYYQDFSQALHHFNQQYFGCFDQAGLPMFGFGENALYHQIYIIQYGLILHDKIIDGVNVEENKVLLGRCVAWLEENQEELEGCAVWRNHFNNNRYALASGWISGMYQGQIISLLLRYGQLTHQEQKYTALCESCFQSFFIPFERGGFQRKDTENNLWFEEYPSPEPSFVLNGFIYALLGIYDLFRTSGNEKVQALFNDGIQTIERSLHKYDSGYWSVYDQLKKELATKYYHKNIHIPLLDILYHITQKPIFLHYKNRWEKQWNSSFNRGFTEIMYRIKPRLAKFNL